MTHITMQGRSPPKGLSFASSSSAEKRGFTCRKCHLQAPEWRLRQPGPNHPSLLGMQGASPAPGHAPRVSLPLYPHTVVSGWNGEAACPQHLQPGLAMCPRTRSHSRCWSPSLAGSGSGPRRGEAPILTSPKAPFHSPNHLSAPQILLHARWQLPVLRQTSRSPSC